MTFYLGLTGGIASGKSTADEFFKKQGYDVIDLDEISHHLLEPHQASWEGVKSEFGPKFLKADQTIDRKKLGQLVFSDIEELKKLNAITHPAIMQEAQKQIQASQADLCVVDEPLLFEDGDQQKYDATLLIAIDPILQVKRLMARSQLTQQAAKRRMEAQMPLRIKRKFADYVVENNGSKADLEKQLQDFIAKLPLKEK